MLYFPTAIEFIPDKLFVHSYDVVNVKSVKESAKVEAPPDMAFAHFFMTLTVAITIMALLVDHPMVKSIVDIRLYCSHVDQILIDFGLIGKAGVTFDAYIATVCWGSTYLFIRRLWNPETMSVAIQRFSADSFFGGLASGGAVLLKAIILHFMSKY
ncbi:hypothetical protein EON65_01125 [archaeon]|nr:MAG: hypothetical protein EON65_01125 [archaeon]